MRKISEKRNKEIEKQYFRCECNARISKKIVSEILKPYCTICGKSLI